MKRRKLMLIENENIILRERLCKIITLCDRWGRRSSSGLQKIIRIAEGMYDTDGEDNGTTTTSNLFIQKE